MTTPGDLRLAKLVDKYTKFGIVKGGELLLPPDRALMFLEELDGLGIGLLGLDGWSYVDKARGVVAQDLDVDLSIDESIILDKDFVGKSIEIARKYINYRLSTRTVFVSLTLHIPCSGKGN